jgi:hypothetical protein
MQLEKTKRISLPFLEGPRMFSTLKSVLKSLFRKPGRRAEDRQFRPGIEALEERWCPSGNTYYWKGFSSGGVASWTGAGNWRLGDGSTPTSYPGQYGIGTPDTAVFDSTAASACYVPVNTVIDIAALQGKPTFPSGDYVALRAGSILAVVGGGNDGSWDTLEAIGTDVGDSNFKNDTGELYIGGGTSSSQASFTLNGWINDASTTTNRGKFAIGPYTTLTIAADDANRIYPNIGASTYIGYDSSLNVAQKNAKVLQNFDVTINNGANLSVADNSTWEIAASASIFNQTGVTAGSFGNYGTFLVDASVSSHEYLPFFNSYQGTAAGDQSGWLTLKGNATLELDGEFMADSQTCVLEQTGLDANGSAMINLYNNATLSTLHISDRFDIKAGGVVLADTGPELANVTGTLWMNGSPSYVDVRCGTGAFTLNTLTVSYLVWDTGVYYTAVNFGSTGNQADSISVTNTATINGGSVWIASTYGTRNANPTTILTAGTLSGQFGGANPEPFTLGKTQDNKGITVTW